MDQRISLITLGVRDMDRATAFYDAMGWARAPGPDGVIAYDLLGQTLGLFGLDKLYDVPGALARLKAVLEKVL